MAKIYQKTPTDKALILGVREWMIYPFQAANWLDLRVGFFLSLTKAVADDDSTGLTETIAAASPPQNQDRYFIGTKTSDSLIPGIPGGRFIGFSNAGNPTGDSLLLSSDIGLGTTNTNYWRPANSANNNLSAVVLDGGVVRAMSADGAQQHFPQSEAGAGGYAVLLGIQVLRSTNTSETVTVKLKSQGHSGDILYSSAPTADLLLNSLQNWPTTLQQLGPVTLTSRVSAGGSALYCYWPFKNSRLRIHAVGVLKAK